MKPVEIELMPDTKPCARKFYNVPKAYKDITKTKINCLCTVNVFKKLSHTTDSPWAASSVCQLKKTNDLCFLTDFREVNKYIQRKLFPLP